MRCYIFMKENKPAKIKEICDFLEIQNINFNGNAVSSGSWSTTRLDKIYEHSPPRGFLFFVHFTALGLANGERCMFDDPER